MARTLLSTPIPDCMNAPEVFGRQGNGGLLVARPGNNSLVPYCSVPEGFYALVTTNGAEVRCGESPVWPSGFFFASPFTKISHLVTKQTVIFDAPVKGCKTADNVTVQIDVSVAFRIMGDEKKGEDPELVRKFVHQVTPAGLESQLKDSLAEEIRTLARSMKHTEVYACRTGAKKRNPNLRSAGDSDKDSDSGDEEGTLSYGDVKKASGGEGDGEDADAVAAKGIDVTEEMQKRLNRQFEPQGVSICDVMIQDVVLPESIVTQMSNKSLVRSKQEYEMMEQQFEMQGITLKNELNARRVGYTEENEKSEVEGARDTQKTADKLNERKATGQRTLSDYEESTRQEVSKLTAETTEMIVGLDFDRKRLMQNLSLEADAEARRIRDEASAAVRTAFSEADLKVVTHKANATKILADADEKADVLLKTARELDLIDERLEVYNSFVSNKSVIISASDAEQVNTLLLSDTVLRDTTSGMAPHELLAQLNVLRLASSAYGLQAPGQSYIPDSMK